MSHLRTLIFEERQQRLSLIPGFEGSGKVMRGRTRAVPEELLPAITLSWADDDERTTLRTVVNDDGGIVDGYERSFPMSIIVHTRHAEPEQEFDSLAVEIEKAMADPISVPGLTIESLLTSSRFFVDRTTGLPLMAGRLVYQVTYKTTAADPAIAGR